jgi:hypothetical protein
VCTLREVTLTCRPVQRPHPPIWIAANSDNAVRRAARLGDTWVINPHATTATIKRQMPIYRTELAHAGKPFPRVLPFIKEIFCAKDTRTALELAGPFLEAKYRTYAAWGQDTVMPGRDPSQPFESLLHDRFVLGSPENCYAQLRPCWAEVGANSHSEDALEWHAGGACAESMRLISDELLPALRRVATAGWSRRRRDMDGPTSPERARRAGGERSARGAVRMPASSRRDRRPQRVARRVRSA